MTKYLNFFESESGFTEAVEAGQLFFPNVSYTEEDDTVHWNLTQPADPVETPMLRTHFSTSTPGQRVRLYRNDSYSGVTAMEIDGAPVNFDSEGYYSIASPGNHTAVYQFASPEIPERLFFVPDEPFGAFTSAEIISPVTSIGNLSFGRCTNISAVTIPDSVTSIGFQAFSVCGDLTGVTIPDSVTTIGFNAFEHTGLRSVTVPDSVTSMGGCCFMVCMDMLSAIIGSGITALPDQTFGGCSSLQSVTLPDNLTSIANEAFLSCYSLHDINIPSGVTTIGGNAFNGCSGLAAIYFNPETPPTLGADALLDTNDCPIYVPAASVEAYQQAWPAYASRIKTKHRISASVNDEDKGEVMLDQETASEGAQVEFDVFVFEPDANQVTSVTVTDGNGDEVGCNEDWDNHYSFDMPASDVTILVTIGEKPKYNITASVEVDVLNGETASEGDTVFFNVEVSDSGQYQVSVTDGNGNDVQVTDEGDNNYSFDMPASDVTISVVFDNKHTVTVNSTDDLVTGAYPINEETGDWDWGYEGEPSFPEGEPADFAIRVPEGYLAVSAQASDEWGDNIDDVNMNRLGDDGVYECMFTMPHCDVSVFITIEKKQ